MDEARLEFIGEDGKEYVTEFIPYKDGTTSEDIKWYIDNVSLSSIPKIFNDNGEEIKMKYLKVYFKGEEQILELK